MKARYWTAACAAISLLGGCGGGATGNTANAGATPAASNSAGNAVANRSAANSAPAGRADANAGAAASQTAATDDSGETVRRIRCRVYDPGGDYDGPCEFVQWGGSSFMVRRAGGAAFFGGVTEVVVEIDAPGVAGGSIRNNGELNPIGQMTRSPDDRACWSSQDFTVCAYG